MIKIKVCNEAYQVEGYTVTVNKEHADTDIREFISTMAVTQLGSGTPSADNVRPFVLYDRYAVRRNNSYVGVRYFDYPIVQGVLDVLTGELTTEWAYIQNYQGEPISGEWMSDRDVYVEGTLPTIGASVIYREPASMQMQGLNVPMQMGSNTYYVQFHGDTWENTILEGDEVSFEANYSTELANLKVDIEPIQNGTPWQSEAETVPYLLRRPPQLGHSYNHEMDEIIGGTVAWNQLVQNGDFASTSGWSSARGTISVSDNILSYTSSEVGGGEVQNRIDRNFVSTANHKYLFSVTCNPAHATTLHLQIRISGTTTAVKSTTSVSTGWGTVEVILAPTFASNIISIGLAETSSNGYQIGDIDKYKNVQIFDLTQMFGSTIADYIYSLEQATAGAGVAWLKSKGFLTKPYYAYNAGELKSVSGLVSHDMVGFNQWDEEWEVGSYSPSTGEKGTNTATIRCKNYIPALPTTAYYSSNSIYNVFCYDEDYGYLGTATYSSVSGGYIWTTLANTRYITFRTDSSYGTTYNHDICINISSDRNGTYEPYQKWSYPLDSDLTLRGIPKLDANNNLYYDGDTYEPDGTVTRKYGIVDLGSLTWSRASTGVSGAYRFKASHSNSAKVSDATNGARSIIANGIALLPSGATYDANKDGYTISASDIIIYRDAYKASTESDFKTAMNGVYLVYELAEPTTESADPYQTPQIVDPNGTEEYVSTSIVPVGHRTVYADIYPISGTDEVVINVADNDSFSPSTDYSIPIGTVYGGTLDVLNGILTVTHGYIGSYNGEALPSAWISDRDVYEAGTTPSIGAQVVYELEEPVVYTVTPADVELLDGINYIRVNSGEMKIITIGYVGETVENGYTEITYVFVTALEGEVCGDSMNPTFVGEVSGFILCKSALCDDELCPQPCPPMGKLEICGEDALHVSSECD